MFARNFSPPRWVGGNVPMATLAGRSRSACAAGLRGASRRSTSSRMEGMSPSSHLSISRSQSGAEWGRSRSAMCNAVRILSQHGAARIGPYAEPISATAISQLIEIPARSQVSMMRVPNSVPKLSRSGGSTRTDGQDAWADDFRRADTCRKRYRLLRQCRAGYCRATCIVL